MNWWVFRTEILGVGPIHAQRPRQAQLRTAGCQLANNPVAGERLLKSVQCTEGPRSDLPPQSFR